MFEPFLLQPERSRGCAMPPKRPAICGHMRRQPLSERGPLNVSALRLASRGAVPYKRRGACVSDTPGGEAAPFLLT
ncbi:Hypothetical protein BN69_1152 [Methylocystis sp. SC2]|nr:Hypothetical protein BN69_1152 [Methylocystis sp. SC2]